MFRQLSYRSVQKSYTGYTIFEQASPVKNFVPCIIFLYFRGTRQQSNQQMYISKFEGIILDYYFVFGIYQIWKSYFTKRACCSGLTIFLLMMTSALKNLELIWSDFFSDFLCFIRYNSWFRARSLDILQPLQCIAFFVGKSNFILIQEGTLISSFWKSNIRPLRLLL